MVKFLKLTWNSHNINRRVTDGDYCNAIISHLQFDLSCRHFSEIRPQVAYFSAPVSCCCQVSVVNPGLSSFFSFQNRDPSSYFFSWSSPKGAPLLIFFEKLSSSPSLSTVLCLFFFFLQNRIASAASPLLLPLFILILI